MKKLVTILLTPIFSFVITFSSYSQIKFSKEKKYYSDVISVSGHQYLIACSEIEGNINLWNQKVAESASNVYDIAFSPDGKYIASGNANNTAYLWEVGYTDALTKEYHGHKDDVLSVCFSHDGTMLATGSADKSIIIWNVYSATMIKKLEKHKGKVTDVCFHPSNQQLVSGSSDNNIMVWDINEGSAIKEITGHNNAVLAVAYSPNGQYIASGSADKTIKIWSTDDYQLLHTFTGHTDAINSLSFHSNSAYLASGSSDNSIIIWNIKENKKIQQLSKHEDVVNAVNFLTDKDNDRTFLLSGSNDNTLKIWDANDLEPTAEESVEQYVDKNVRDWQKKKEKETEKEYKDRVTEEKRKEKITEYAEDAATKYEAEEEEVKDVKEKIEEKTAPIEETTEVAIKEDKMKKKLKESTEEMYDKSMISKNVKINVSSEVLTEKTTTGKKEKNLHLVYTYKVMNRTAQSTDDYPMGEYKVEKSKAAMIMLQELKESVENDLTKYLEASNKITVKITGTADATPVVVKIPYDGSYGNYTKKGFFFNGTYHSITVTEETGITTNSQLAFLRTLGVEKYLKNNIKHLNKKNTSFRHYTVMKTERGAEHRWISVELIMHNCFEDD